jgi:soluble lytic murein transglycosylase
MCEIYLNRRQQAMERLYQTILKYPSSPEALQIAEMLDAYDIDEKKYIFPVADVYLNHRIFSKVRERLEKFIRTEENRDLIEKARYYLLRVYYEEGQYQTAIYGFNTLLQDLKNEALKPRILLMIARCELRAGHKINAVNSYLRYAEAYPRRRMAVEAVWKAAWIYEELGDIDQSLIVYEKLKKHWPYSTYREETEFRIGFSHYRLGQYIEAASAFRFIIGRNGSTFYKHRASYWLAKTYQQRGMDEQARKIYLDLGSQVLNSYYALKAYFENQANIDSMFNFKKRLAQIDNPLRQYAVTISPYMTKFKKLFVVHELLSDSYSYQEVNEKKYRASSVGEWIALAEIHKRLGAYNRAFQIYDYLDNKHFYEMDNLEKPFLLKEAFPLYYDSQVSEYAKQRQVDRKLILAVIRAESAYNKRAHSWADAYGLMQIIPRTAAEIAGELSVPYEDPENLYNADLNINMGTYYLKKLLRQFNNTYEYALAAYNAGPHRVTKWLKILPENDIDVFVENIEFSQTRNYVRKVLRNYWIYSFLEEVN